MSEHRSTSLRSRSQCSHLEMRIIFFTTLSVLERIEKDSEPDEDYLKYLLSRALYGNELIDLYIQSFFRDTKNEKIRNVVLEFLTDFDDDDKLSESIINRYDSKEEIVVHAEMTNSRFVNEDKELYDENIFFSQLTSIGVFGD